MAGRPRKQSNAPRGKRAEQPASKRAEQTNADRVDAAAPVEERDTTDTTARPINDSAPRRPGRPSNADKLREQLGASITTLGIGVGIVAGMRDGAVIVQNAGDLADALVKLGEANPRVHKLLVAATTQSAWAGVIFVTARISLQIAANHGAQVPSFLIGVPSTPGDLSSNGSAQ